MLDHQFHVLGSFDGRRLRERGRFLERRRREISSQNLEREGRRNYEDFASKSLIYSLAQKY
jgi:hypothetical protein